MQKYIYILLILSTNFLFAQQSGVVEYGFYYEKFHGKPKSKINERSRKMADMTAEYAKNHKYILKFNPNESIYYVEESIPLDDVNEFAYRFSKSIFSKGTYYQNKLKRESLQQLVTMNKLYLVKDSMPNDWKIMSEHKYIGKYKCYKAVSSCNTCNKNQIITAWFTPDIPLPFGPAGYGGTPGLILEVQRYRYTLRLKKIRLSNEIITIERPLKGTLTTARELKALQWSKRMELIQKRRKH